MSIVATEKKIKTVSVQAQSSSPKHLWTEDEVCNREIYAYEKGKEHMKQQFKKKVEANLLKAKSISEKIIINLLESKITCKGIHLRQLDSNNFSTLFLIPQKDFLSVESYTKIYEIASNLVSSELKNGFHFEYMFIPFSKKLNEDAILADGYRWTLTI